MILELKVPKNPTWQNYLEAYPIFASYALSYISIGIFWISHHNLFQTVKKVDNKVFWANMLALFWQSLIPFTTASMGENSFSGVTVTVHAIVLILGSLSYIYLINILYRLHGANSDFSKAFIKPSKSFIIIAFHLLAAIIAFCGFPKIGFIIIALTALTWFIPNHRFEE